MMKTKHLCTNMELARMKPNYHARNESIDGMLQHADHDRQGEAVWDHMNRRYTNLHARMVKRRNKLLAHTAILERLLAQKTAYIARIVKNNIQMECRVTLLENRLMAVLPEDHKYVQAIVAYRADVKEASAKRIADMFKEADAFNAEQAASVEAQ